MGWAKIEIHFQPERHDPNEVMLFLADHFKADDGAPTATVEIVGMGPEDEPPVRLTSTQQARMGLQKSSQQLGMTVTLGAHGVTLPTPYSAAHLAKAADDLCAFYPASKIGAIRDLRTISGLGLKEAKDEIDAAFVRAVRRNHP